jgi:DNA adenine methylase
MTDPNASLVPFLKWAGGKRWLAAQYPGLFPATFERYVEPFLGSGAVYFHLKPGSALIADSNIELINTYKSVRTSWDKVNRALKRHHRNHSERYYYVERSKSRVAPHELAAQFIYLNRTCWNGLYRVNLRGEFNVPIGTKTSVILKTDDFRQISKLLRMATIKHADFETTINQTKEGDFLFVDPPYVTRHNFNGFAKYNDKVFAWADQERLAQAIRQASARNVKILVTNADHISVRELYHGLGRYVAVQRHSVLAADSHNRGLTTELAIVINYEPEFETDYLRRETPNCNAFAST